jgi:hypothetical protein
MALTFRTLPPEERRKVARAIEGELRRRGESAGLNEWEHHQMRVRMNVVLARLMDAEVSDAALFDPTTFAATMPVILVALGQSDTLESKRFARRIRHELAESLQRDWVAPNVYDTDVVICDRQDNRKVRHEIARMVERLSERGQA